MDLIFIKRMNSHRKEKNAFNRLVKFSSPEG